MRCDSHVHIVGPPDRYPQVAARTYLAGVAALDTLQRTAAPRGVTRFVIVQPSFYGTDNTLLLESLDALGGEGRGIAVIDAAATPRATLADYAARGVRGLRINLYSRLAGQAPQALDVVFAAMAQVARDMGWHVQVIAPLDVLIDSVDVLTRAPVPVVIDHYGLYGPSRPESAVGHRLMELLRLPHVWIKLSAPYRPADGPLSTKPDREWLAAILSAAPERCVWGSDWPHPPPQDRHKGGAVAVSYRGLSYEALVDDFIAALASEASGQRGNFSEVRAPDTRPEPGSSARAALPSATLADAIMRDNAARLYAF